MLLSIKEITAAYQLVISRVEKLEARSFIFENDNKRLQQDNAELHQKIEQLSVINADKETTDTISTQINNISCFNKDLQKKFCTLEISYNKLASELANAKNQYNTQIEVLNSKCEKVNPLQNELLAGGYIKQIEEKVLEVERALNILSANYAGSELQLQASLASTYNGAFLWHVPEIRRFHDAKIGRITSIYSLPFYTGRNGYKMCIRAYLNGDGSGERTHLSIFFVIMKGEYDPLLRWPFEHKVSLVLVDQEHKKHLVQTLNQMFNLAAFKDLSLT